MFRRVNLCGGPGVGKSVLAAWLASELQLRGHRCALVTEYIKDWAYEQRMPQSFDQLYIQGAQIRREDLPLRNGFPFIITDSPVLLSYVYAGQYSISYQDALFESAKCVEEKYPSLNLLLSRTVEYQECGRYQKEDEAREIDRRIEEVLDLTELSYCVVDPTDREDILEYIEEQLRFSTISDPIKIRCSSG